MENKNGAEVIPIEIGDIIGFRYNRRYCHGLVIRFNGKFVIVRLLIDYIGKNEEWFVGEEKAFSRKAMLKLTKFGK